MWKPGIFKNLLFFALLTEHPHLENECLTHNTQLTTMIQSFYPCDTSFLEGRQLYYMKFRNKALRRT